MKKNEIKVGGLYSARISGRFVTVRVNAIREAARFSKTQTVYDVTNLDTKRKTTFYSAMKFRREVSTKEVESELRNDPLGKIMTSALKNMTSDFSDPTQDYYDPVNDSTPVGPAVTEFVEDELVIEPPQCDIDEQDVLDEAKQIGANSDEEDEQRSDPILSLHSSQENFNGSMVRDSEEAKGLGEDQLRAYAIITDMLSGDEAIVKLVGYAGTGKTFLLARLAKWAKRQKFEVTIAAPTHKAAGVIKSKLGDSTVTVRTIHSLLGLRLEPDFTADSGGRILQAADSKSKVKGGLVICDEASMVGSVLKEHIEKVSGVKWLFVGDLAQLPPVGESTSELLNNPDATLEEVLRQAKGSEILNLATAIRGGDLSMDFEEGKDVYRVGSAEELFQAALKRFQSEDYKKDAAYARMLVFRNDRRRAINERMRQLIVGKPEPYADDEWLVMYSAFAPEKSKLSQLAEAAKAYRPRWKDFFNYKDKIGNNIQQLHVSQEVKVLSAREDQLKMSDNVFDIWRLSVLTQDEREFELPVLQNYEEERYKGLLRLMADGALEAKTLRDQEEKDSSKWFMYDKARKEMWAQYFALEEVFAQVDYAYAMTVHKSQGSTFDHVFVDVPDLLMSGDDMRQQILYTACTRPAKTLTFYQ